MSETVLTGDIQLTLGGGEIISVADSSAEIRYDRKGNLTVQEDTIETGEKETAVLHTIQVPYGKRSKIILADGSTVHLNSGTSFVYPSVFDAKRREVFLNGEAFFDVRKEKGKSFVVKTPFKTVEVLGTRFNVSADKEDKQFEAVLLSGKIALDGEKGTIEMQPNQLYRYSEEQKRETIKEVEAGNYISWIDGRIVFEQEPLHAVIRKLEKMYNVRISLLDQSLLTHSISGDLNIKDSPEETMNILMNILIAGYDPQEGKLYRFQR